MKVLINTDKLQGIIDDIAKGVGYNKLLPITNMVGITFTDEGKLQFISTDGTNFLRVSNNNGDFGDEEEAGHVTVDADLFISLVGKLSDCSAISLETSGNTLTVKGHKGTQVVGEYKLELPIDDEGNPVKFVDIDSKIEKVVSANNIYEIKADVIEELRNSCKQALSTNISEPCYTNYLISKDIVSTDRTRAVFVHKDLINQGSAFLLGRNFVDLLSIAGDTIKLYVSDTGIYAKDESGTEIFTTANGELDGYNESAVKGMLSMEFPSMCKVKKSELVNTLGRMLLFCSKYDNNGIDIDFEEDRMTIHSLKDSAVEIIEYSEYKDIVPCSIRVDVTLLASHVKAYATDTVELYFGNPKAIKFVEGDVTQILALVAK